MSDISLTVGGAEFTMPDAGRSFGPLPPPGPDAKLVSTSGPYDCRHGKFRVINEDELVGDALVNYGEYSEGEVIVLKKCLRDGMTALDVGANIGALTVPMAELVGETGTVIAFEAAPINVPVLHANLNLNLGRITQNIAVIPKAAYSREGEITVSKQDALHAYCRPDINRGDITVPCTTIDSLNLQECHFIKIDVDQHELEVLKGADATITRHKPIIYIENEARDKAQAVTAWLVDHGYRCYWHLPPHYNPDNFRKETRNYFGNLVSIMMLCVPEPSWDGRPWEITGLDEVADIRDDDRIFDRESDRYKAIVERNPNDMIAWLMWAHYENLMQRDPYPIINRALEIKPGHKPILNVKALLDLQRGEYTKENWVAYELRYYNRNPAQFGGNRVHSNNTIRDVPHWDGDPTDKPVLIWSEQGFGDQIMWARFMMRVKQLAPNAFLEVHPALYELFDASRDLLGLGPNDLFALRRSLPPYDFQASITSLCDVLNIDQKTCQITEPYLRADPMLVKNWQGKGNHAFMFGRHPMNEAKIGLCAVGSVASERPYTRDLPKDMISKLVKNHGPFFSLEYNGQFENFAMTAAAIEALDLVITVDTSIAHLAGGLGKETWLLLSVDPDWRWGLKGKKTVWYPSIRIFRQPKVRDWGSVIDQVSEELHYRYAQEATE